MPKTLDNPFAQSHKHLAKLDPRMKALIARAGPCTLQPEPDPFHILACSIVSQQISTKAAESIRGRVTGLCGRGARAPRRPTALAEPWRPWRTVATWYFWKGRGFVPQSE